MPPAEPPPPKPDHTPGLRRLAVYAFCYALVFPLTTMVGHGAELLGLLVTFPFLVVGGVMGSVAGVAALGGVLGDRLAALIGLTSAIFIQAYLCALIWASARLPTRN